MNKIKEFFIKLGGKIKRFFIAIATNKKYLAIALSSIVVVGAAAGTAIALANRDGSGSGKESSSGNTSEEFDGVGDYYCDTADGEYNLSLKDNAITLTMGGDVMTGTYTYDGEALNVAFKNGSVATATVGDNVMTLLYDGSVYKFYKKVNYTVTFETSGGSAVESISVVNGKAVASPEDPTKEGYVFIGWYLDSTFKTPYAFAKSVTSDMTLYARFVQSPTNPAEFTVKFVVDGNEAFAPVQTKDGIVYNAELPTPEKEGAEFIGWWVSDFEDANKLTYKYEEQVLGEHTTLYAVWADDSAKISVAKDEITWTAEGVNNSYKVVVKNAAGEELLSRNTSTPKVAFDFAQQPAGEYVVEVSFSGKTATAYYNNKALDKICVFDVIDSTVSFNAVANAEKYLITVDCANDEHQHTDLDLGTSTYYNFSACDMQVGGIVFTVTAVAEGYISSTSEEFIVERTLTAVADLTVDDASETATWSAVENATAYVISIENNGNVTEKTIAETTYSLKGMTGEIKISVYPTGKGYNPAAAVSYTYTNTRLAVPSGLKLSGQSVVWEEVDGATKYNVKIGDKVFETETTSLVLETKEHFADGLDSYLISVQAVAAEAAKTSLYSDTITINCNKMSDTLTYNKGAVVWDYVLGAAKYGVKVNDGEEYVVENTENSYEVILTQSGTNTIYVRCYDATNEPSAWVSIEVTANTITFETMGEAVTSMYKVQGDPYVLPTEATRDGYNFAGWYDIPDGPENSGTRLTEGVMDGDLTVYAGWTSKAYTVTFDLGDYGEMTETETTVYYAKDYTLPTPTVVEVTKAFAGWYTGPQGSGFRYTDYLGASMETWKDLNDRTLYAYYVDIFTFTLNEDDNNESYSVAKGDGVAYVAKLTIPAIYEGKPVTRLDSEAFRSISSLTEINIPDTVTSIVIPNGGTAAGSAFYVCNNLKNVNIYCSCEDANAHRRLESRYASVDGVLFYNSEYSGMSVVYVPHARTGSYTLPAEVTMLSGEKIPLQTIPAFAFRNIKLSEIVIPATVTKIEASAFLASAASYALLESVIFAPAAEGEEELPLEIMDEAFYGQANLTSLNLPARIKEFRTTILDGLTKLENIDITGNPVGEKAQYASVEGMLTNAAKTEILYVPKARTGVFTINTTSISTIGAYALQNIDGITSIVIPAHVTEIKEGAFYDCDGVESIIFEGTAEDALLNIRTLAFYGVGGGGTPINTPLTTITLPANIGIIEKSAFGGVATSTEGKRLTVNVIAGGSQFAEGAFGTTATSPSFYVETLNLGKDVVNFSIPSVFGAVTLKFVTVDPENQYFTSDEDGVLYDKDVTMIAYFPAGISVYDVPKTVTTIGDQIFRGKTDLTKVIIPASVSSIGDYAFYGCTKLSQVIFGDASELDSEKGEVAAETLTIGNQAFYNCIFTSIQLPERLTELGDKVFYSCDFTTITIPKNVTKLGATENIVDVFYMTSALAEIIVDEDNARYMSIDGVLYEKNENGDPIALCFAPKYCVLKNNTLDVPSTVTSFYAEAFSRNEYITTITFSQGIQGENLTFGDSVFSNSKVSNVELPEGLTAISEKMFYYAETLTRINIPTTVTSIQKQAFYYCKALEEVTFSDRSNVDTELRIESVTSSGYSPFYLCNALKKLILPANTTYIGDYALYASSGTATSASQLEELFIPNTVTYIGKNAVYNCVKLTKLTFEEGIQLEAIDGQYSFHGCVSLKTLDLPESIKSIGKYAFGYLGVENLVIPASVTSIGDDAFQYGSFKTVTFAEGSQLQTISNYAFWYSKNLESVSIPATVTTIGSGAFTSCTALKSLTFETNEDGFCSLMSIDRTAFSNTRITELTLPETTADKLTIGLNAFLNCKKLETVTLNSKVTSVDEVFSGCPALSKVVIPETNEVLKIDESKMMIMSGSTIEFVYGHLKNTADKLDYDTYTLENGVLTIKEGVEEINVRAFQHQTDITKVVLPASLKTIGNYAFFNCVNLETVEFTKTNAGSVFDSIGQYAFNRCLKLKNINLPTTTTTIGSQAFRYCYSLEEITLPASLTYTAANNATNIFDSCRSLQTVTFEEDAVIEYMQNNMFSNCPALKNVTIPESVKTLGTSMFQACTSLESIHIPSQVTVLADKMFMECTSLQTVTVGGTIKQIGASTFVSCSALTSDALFDLTNVTKVGSYAFSGTGLTEISLPALTSLGTNAFDGCTALESVTLNDALKTIDSYTFQNCTALKNIVLPSGLTKVGDYAFSGSGLTEITLPDTIEKSNLCKYAFADCSDLASVKLSANLTQLSNNTFQNCISLESIEIPSKITIIQGSVFKGSGLVSITLPKLNTAGTYMFQDCTALESVTLTAGTAVNTGMFDGCTALKTLTFPTLNKAPTQLYLLRNCTSLESVTLSSTFTSIPSYMFTGCTSLTSVTCEGAVTKIGTYAFQDCTSLKSYAVPSAVTMIDDYAFNGCTSLESVTLPTSVTTIDVGAFQGCTSLKRITLNNGLTTIGSSAFAFSGLERLNVPSSVSSILGGAFNGCENLTEVTFNNDYYRIENGIIYNSNDEIVSVLANAELPDGVLTIGEGYGILAGALVNCPTVTKIVLPASILAEDGTLVKSLFSGANYLKEVVLPEGLTAISEKMFQNATALEKVEIPDTVTLIDVNAFDGCTSLTTLDLPEGLTTIGNYAFEYSGIETLTLPQSLTSLGSYLFMYCASLETVIFPENCQLTSIGTSAFNGSAIQYIDLPDSITDIGAYAFQNCVNLKSIQLPAHLETLGTSSAGNVFMGSGLESIVIPASITSWSSNVFKDCVNLKTAVFEEGFTSFGGTSYGASLFYGCTALESVTLASTMVDIPNRAFYGCTALKEIYVPDDVVVGSTTFEAWTPEQKIYTSLNLRSVMLCWTENWNTSTDATLVTDYVPEAKA